MNGRLLAQTATQNCQNPTAYNLSYDEVNISNSDFYCWEIRYLRDYQNLLSMNINSYYALYPKNLSIKNIDILRKNGITPEKADYLFKYFIETPIDDDKNFEKVLSGAIAKAKSDLSNKLQYSYGRPVWFIQNILSIQPLSVLSNIKTSSIYYPMLKVFGIDCLNLTASGKSAFDVYPNGLKPAGVVGRYIVNPFAEIVGEIRKVSTSASKTVNKVYRLGDKNALGTWNEKSCNIHDIGDEIKRTFSCTACTMFEIAFNTVSRIGFVLYDKLSRYAIDLMVALFALWSLSMFFENAIKKQDGFAYIKTFFTRVVWVFIISAFLSVSITDENNIVNYSVKPITEFMVGYNRVLTSAIDKDGKPWTCKYATKDIADNKVLFSASVKKDIVCTIERIGDFNNLNIMIGKYQVIQGWRQLVNFEIGTGLIKIILGITIMGMFFIYNLTVPFFFIESLYKIALVVFLFPLFLMAYALDKKSFVRSGLDTFLSAVFQIISLSIMCSVVALLMNYISTLDFYGLQSAIENNDAQEMTSQIILALSFNTNRLLEILYTGIICWYLMGQSLTIANKFSGYASTESLPKKFVDWTKNLVVVVSSVGREKLNLKVDTDKLADKLSKQIMENIRDKKEIINNYSQKSSADKPKADEKGKNEKNDGQ